MCKKTYGLCRAAMQGHSCKVWLSEFLTPKQFLQCGVTRHTVKPRLSSDNLLKISQHETLLCKKIIDVRTLSRKKIICIFHPNAKQRAHIAKVFIRTSTYKSLRTGTHEYKIVYLTCQAAMQGHVATMPPKKQNIFPSMSPHAQRPLPPEYLLLVLEQHAYTISNV